MADYQGGILAAVPRVASYLTLTLQPDADPRPALRRLAGIVDPAATVVGVGLSTARACGAEVPGLHDLAPHSGAGLEVPATPAGLWFWLRGTDRGELVHRSRAIRQALGDGFRLESAIEAFQYLDSRDLTGYEDGTEDPQDDAALEAAFVAGRGAGLDGSSFVAVQQWLHDLDRFATMTAAEQDATIGRRRADNAELDDAPASAHVRRTAQESYEPAAFVLRRSMPWADGRRAGLVFVAFGHSLAAFEVMLRRMVGAEDGIADGLFRFTRPLSGAGFWCPPTRGGRLDLSALGL